jgi:hypothetical protein
MSVGADMVSPIYGLADLVRGEHEVVADLVFGEAQVLQPGIAHRVRRMAVQAVVHEDRRAALQRSAVVQVDGRVLELNAAAGSERDRGNGDEKRQDSLHHHTTRAGSGRSLSLAVYHGISRKKRK